MSPALSIKETPIYIDASMIKCFADCREQFRRRYIENIVPVKPSINMVFGSAIHMAVEALWKGENLKSACGVGFDYLDSVDESRLLVKEVGKLNQLISILPDMLEVYYKAHDWSNESDGVILLEHEWLHEYSDGVVLCGKIDRYSPPLLSDLKTASEIGKEWKKNYKAEKLRDCGLALYDWYLCKIGQAPEEIEMEVILKPYKDKPPRIEPIPLSEIISQRERFDKQLRAYVTDIVHYMRKNAKVAPWEMNFGPMCMTKYGECDYLKLCNYGNIPKYISEYKTREEHLEIRRNITTQA